MLTVPVETLMRVSSNPFFTYLAERLTAWTDPRPPALSDPGWLYGGNGKIMVERERCRSQGDRPT